MGQRISVADLAIRVTAMLLFTASQAALYSGVCLAQANTDVTTKQSVGQPQLVTQKGHAGEIEAMAFSPDDTLLATGGEDSAVKIWDLRTSSITHSFDVDGSWDIQLAFSPDGKILAPFLAGGKAPLRDADTGKLLKTLVNGSDPSSLDFSPNGDVLALGGTNESVSLWSYRTAQRLRSIKVHVGWVGMVKFSSDGLLMACAGGRFGMGNKDVEVWNA